MISIFYLEWLRYRWFSICLIMVFVSTYCDIFTSMWAFSYTLSLCVLEMWIALVLSWSRSMYDNCSILYLAFYVAWFVRRLWSASVTLFLLLVRLDLFAALCHIVLVMIHVIPSCCSSPVYMWLSVGWVLHPFEMSCTCDPHFSCCGWWVGTACDHWWLFFILWFLCLGLMRLDLPCCLGGLCLPWGLFKLI
jgi:hypothetical protein